jgi:hypothetical protein
MLRSALSAFTRVFDALWRCAADPGSTYFAVSLWVPAQLHRVRDTKRRRQLSRFTAALQHRSDQAEKVVIYEAVGLRQRFDRALFLASVGHDADEVFSRFPLLRWHVRSLHGPPTGQTMRARRKIGGKFSTP